MKTLFPNSPVLATAATLGAALTLLALTGCVTTQQQADGSTRVNVSVAQALGLKQAAGTPAAPAPQAVAAQPVRTAATTAQSIPTRIKLSNKARAALARMLECRQFVNSELDVGVELGKANAWGEPAYLDQPVMVYGFPVSKFEITADGSAATYIAYFSGVNSQQFIKAAKMKISKRNKKFAYRDASAGEIAFDHTAPEVKTECNIDTEGPYEEAVAPVKTKKNKK